MVDGLPLHVTIERAGAGRPLLLVNGIGATGELFGPLREHLRDRETIAFDAPGVGDSRTPCLPKSMRSLAGLVSRLVDRLGHTEIDVLGLSWGGALAQELAWRFPKLVRRVVLVATMHGVTSIPGRPVAMSILLSPLRYYSPRYLERVAPVLYGGAIARNPKLLREHAALRSDRPPTLLGYTYQLMAVSSWTSAPYLPLLTQPTLILAGDDDPIVPPINARVMARLIPRSELHVLQGAGHLFLYLRAEEATDRITRFLDADVDVDATNERSVGAAR